MFKCVWLICVSVVLSACVFQTQTQKPPLLVDKITTDNNNESLIKQINIKFNQDIAIVGAVPTQAQVDAVTISHQLHQQCQWRFIKLNTLSCDLKTRLKFMTDYQIFVDSTFRALDKPLGSTFRHIISTPVPDIQFDQDSFNTDFPSILYFSKQDNIDISLSSLVKELKLKSPSGKLNSVLITHIKKYNRERVGVEIQNLPEVKEDGIYQLVLPKGFKASSSQRALIQERVVKSFKHNNQLTFYGVACEIQGYPTKFEPITSNSLGVLPCAPEKIALEFSHYVDAARSGQSVNWFNDSAVKFAYHRAVGNTHYFVFEYAGNSNYQIDLSKLRSDKGNVKNARVVKFTTQEATPVWEVAQKHKKVVESQSNESPQLLRRNVEPLTQTTTPIISNNELLAFINNEKSLTTTSVIAPTSLSKKVLAAQPIEFRDVLSQSSGLAHIKLSGLSNEHDEGLLPKSESFMVNVAAYNIAIWHQRDLLIQLINWEGNYIHGANITLVCEGQKSPLQLGKTQQDGMLWLKAKQWQAIYSSYQKKKKSCWLWNEKGALNAAMKLPSITIDLSDSIKSMAWTTQPIYQRGDNVEISFVARQRSSQGFLPLTSNDNYQLEVKARDQDAIALTMTTPSNMGFAHASFTITQDMPQGYYSLRLVEKKSGAIDYIGDFKVTEFTPPEFEQRIVTPEVIVSNKVARVSVSANRMNGAVLKEAKVNIRFEINRAYDVLDSWPKDYEFTSWSDFEDNKNGQESGRLLSQPLDKQGSFSTELRGYKSTVPFGNMKISSEIIAANGTTKINYKEVPYYSRKHYIGTRFDPKKQQLHVIAIDRLGNELNNISTAVEIYLTNKQEKNKIPKKLASCQFNTLPSFCKIKAHKKALDVVIHSGKNHYQWQRTILPVAISKGIHQEVEVEQLKNKLTLTVNNKDVLAGDIVNVTLSSPFSGTATVIVNSETIKKTWQQAVVKGKNVISIDTQKGWLPSVRLFVSLAVSREIANEQVKQQMAKLALKERDRFESLARDVQELGSQRLLTSNISIPLKNNQPALQVNIHNVTKDVQAGDTVDLIVTANHDAQSQLWLVNDALLHLAGKRMADYDFNEQLYGDSFNSNSMAQKALSDGLILNAIVNIEVTGAMSFDIGGADAFGATGMQLSPMQNKHSQRLPLMNLKADEQQKISVKLPSLIGRWKVIALTATSQTSSIDAINITTTRPVEYFIDAPAVIYEGDKTNLAITAINQSETMINDTISLWNGKALLGTINVHLKPTQQHRYSMVLPALAIKDHLLHITSQQDSNYINYHKIKVKRSTFEHEKQWLIKASQEHVIAKPQTTINDTIELDYRPVGGVTPDWTALANYNKNYPYQCWEQKVSRALSFSNNPQMSKVWPHGDKALQAQINANHDNDVYSYFPYTRGDLFLTAYTNVVDQWLDKNKSTIDIDVLDDNAWLKFTLVNKDKYILATQEARSMAMLALAMRREITLKEALKYRQEIGLTGSFSTILQSLALKELGASKALYQVPLSTINDTIYQDVGTNISSETSYQCFAALAYDEGSVKREELTARVIAKQQKLGHFGSTFANGVCSYLLRDKKVNSNVGSQSLTYQMSNNTLNYHIDGSPAHWLTLRYQQALDGVKAQSNGINIKRERFVRVDDLWLPVTQTMTLKVGDIVKTKLTVDSPIKRKHIAVTDNVAGGLEVISPLLENVFYNEDDERGWSNQNHVDINNGIVKWYIINLNKNQQHYSYYSRVRHQGQFITGPARAEAMYRSDINARTASSEITID